MKLITAYTVAAALLYQIASAGNTSCSNKGETIAGDEIVDIKAVVLSYGGEYRVSGHDASVFAMVGGAGLLMRRIKFKALGGSTHLNASTVANGVQEVIDCCFNHDYTECFGNTEATGDQGDTVNIEIRRYFGI